MEKKDDILPDWQKPILQEKILEETDRFMAKNICYGEDKVLGFPGTTPEPISVEIYCRHLERHPNNIGIFTNRTECEAGFEGTQEAERQVIAMVADLIGATPDKVDGYISPGGTEANIVGCWIGRNVQKDKPTAIVEDKPTAIVGSFLTHYSIVKAADILRIGTQPKEDGSGLHTLGTDESGHVLIEQLEDKLVELAKKGVSNIIVIGNAGTTMLGSVDNIPEMNKVIGELSHHFPKTNIYFHIDAAFGGFVIPFIQGLPDIGFKNDSVDSITIDVHKMGLAPYGSGIIVARRRLFERIRSKATYIPGGDCTLCGSRAGVMALSCWATMRAIGKDGYAENAKRLMQLTDYIQQRFKESNITTFDSDINIVAVKEPLPPSLSKKYTTHTQSDFPVDLSNPSSPSRMSVWNIVAMHHTTKELINELLEEWRKHSEHKSLKAL